MTDDMQAPMIRLPRYFAVLLVCKAKHDMVGSLSLLATWQILAHGQRRQPFTYHGPTQAALDRGANFQASQFLLSEIHSLFTGRQGLIEQQSNMAIRLTSYSGNKQQPKCLTKIANAKFSLDWFEILWPGAIKATLLVT
jgi:hypothetical protein